MTLNHPSQKYDRQIGSFPQVRVTNIWVATTYPRFHQFLMRLNQMQFWSAKTLIWMKQLAFFAFSGATSIAATSVIKIPMVRSHQNSWKKTYQFAMIHSPNTHHALEKMQLFHIKKKKQPLPHPVSESCKFRYFCISDGSIWRILVIPWHSRKLFPQTLVTRLEKRTFLTPLENLRPDFSTFWQLPTPPPCLCLIPLRLISKYTSPQLSGGVRFIWPSPWGGPAMIYMCIYVYIYVYIYINRGVNVSWWGGVIVSEISRWCSQSLCCIYIT